MAIFSFSVQALDLWALDLLPDTRAFHTLELLLKARARPHQNPDTLKHAAFCLEACAAASSGPACHT